MSPTHHPHWSTLAVCLLLVSSTGCLMTQRGQELAAERKEKVELKKRRFNELYQQIKSAKLQEATPPAKILQAFGDPDDILRSGSNTSTMEIWTYEKVMDNGETDTWQNIRLYFVNDKLVSWKY